MARFFDNETKQPVKVIYISSSRKGYVVLQEGGSLMDTRRKPMQVVLHGPGKVTKGVATNPGTNESTWFFTDLEAGTNVIAMEGEKIVAKIPVEYLHDLGSYKAILARIGTRLLNIDLDSHIEYVYWGSKELNEGIYFRAKSVGQFHQAIDDARQFQLDDRADPIGALAAFATVGKGYREISTPSLHVAIHERVCSIHIDSFAFLIASPYGGTVIQPDALQHILDELILRMPMAWFRRKGLTWAAAVMQSIHSVLPNSSNQYSPQLGLRIEVGRKPDQNWIKGTPDIYLESTYNLSSKDFKHELSVQLLHGKKGQRDPDWVLSAKAIVTCPTANCANHLEMVGLYLTGR